MPKNISVEWYPSEGGLAEIYQKTGMQFAFVSSPKEGTKQCHKLVKCRDFLHDAVASYISGKERSIYSFHYTKDDPPIDMAKMRMLVTIAGNNKKEDKEVKDWMKSGLNVLNHFEEVAGLQRSKLYKVDDDKRKNMWLFIGSSVWMKTPYLISLYTFLIRLGSKKIEFKTEEELLVALKNIADNDQDYPRDNDTQYLKTMWNKIHIILRNRKKLFGTKIDDIYTSNVTTNSLHNQSGILSLCKGITTSDALNKAVKKLFVEEKVAAC